MKKLVRLFFVVLMIGVFFSCKKEYVVVEDSSIVRNDKPPKAMFEYERQYGDYYSVYIEADDLENVKYLGQYATNSYTYYDPNVGQVQQNSWQDFYKITAKKYWGVYQSKIYISEFTDYFLVSGNDLDNIREIVKRKGATVLDINGIIYDSRWRSISAPK